MSRERRTGVQRPQSLDVESQEIFDSVFQLGDAGLPIEK
jgi:hypothetical protein